MLWVAVLPSAGDMLLVSGGMPGVPCLEVHLVGMDVLARDMQAVTMSIVGKPSRRRDPV
jgi:hypothetical protein